MHAITGITGKVKSAAAHALLEKPTKTALKFHHGDINMRKLTLTLANVGRHCRRRSRQSRQLRAHEHKWVVRRAAKVLRPSRSHG